MDTLDLAAIQNAAVRIAGRVLRTPVIRHPLTKGELLLKAESLQPTGAFKLRGAFNSMLQLPPDCPGVVAHSSGNHALAVAHAARELGLPAVIVMPRDARQKRAGTRARGAEVVLVGPDSEERKERADAVASERGFALIAPYDDLQVAAGQGTAALELLEDSGLLERFYAPVSGGGLMSGCGVAVRALSPGCEIVAVEPESKNALQLGLERGERCEVPVPDTIADGLRVRAPGERTWPILRETVDRVALVSDAELLRAMGFALRELRLVLEPSGAAALAVALREAEGRCGVILSGGNVAPELLAKVAGTN